MDDVIPPEPATLALLDCAAAIAGADPAGVGTAMRRALDAATPAAWVDELVLQSLLMVGWPKTLNAAAAWRDISGTPAPATDPDAEYERVEEWVRRGEATCQTIYGRNYERLRANVRALHPALDRWMVTEGYGRTLSRPGLDLRRRELCTVAQCAVQGVPVQLHSHLRGARNAGASPGDLRAALAAATPWQDPASRREAERLLEQVLG